MSDTPYPIRPIEESEFEAFHIVIEQAFNQAELPSDRAETRARLSLDRTLAAFDGSQIVGCTAVFPFQMTVPGTALPVAGVTMVGVAPTHRRRGVLRGLMNRQLADLHAGGEAVAALWASEAAIYGRYGYGCASWHAAFTVHRGESAYLPGVPTDPRLRLRLVDPSAGLTEMKAVFGASAGSRPGIYARDDPWWTHRLHDPEHDREGFGALGCVIAEDDDGPRGYALFAIQPSWPDDGLPQHRLNVREICALDPASYGLVWRHLLDRDLVGTVTAPDRPLDDPLLSMVADPRRLRTRLGDGLYVRLVDVDEALSARAYSAPVDVVLEIEDRDCPWNRGRWRLVGDTTTASCTQTTHSADVALPVSVLGSAYLGGLGLVRAAGAGLLREHTPGAVTALSRAFAWDPQPWCPMVF
jgi:predicted acetyltransferase